MALKYSEIEKLIESKDIKRYLRGFLRFVHTTYIGVHSGQLEELPGMNETFVAGMVLIRLLDTPKGRKLSGIRASNKVYDAKSYGLQSPQLEIGRKLFAGELSRDDAYAELKRLFATADIHPDRKSILTLLDSLAEEAAYLTESLTYMASLVGFDGTEEGARHAANEILKLNRSGG